MTTIICSFSPSLSWLFVVLVAAIAIFIEPTYGFLPHQQKQSPLLLRRPTAAAAAFVKTTSPLHMMLDPTPMIDAVAQTYDTTTIMNNGDALSSLMMMLNDATATATTTTTTTTTAAAALSSSSISASNTMMMAFTDQGQNLAGIFFQASLLPYLLFLYFLSFKANRIPAVGNFGFQYLLLFVLSTIPAGIVSKATYGTSLANVDWLHGGAEALLTVSNILLVSVDHFPFFACTHVSFFHLGVLKMKALMYALTQNKSPFSCHY